MVSKDGTFNGKSGYAMATKARGMRSIDRRRHVALLALILLLVAPPALLTEGQAIGAGPQSEIPLAFDTFLASVRRATPATARVLALGEPPVLVFERPVFSLYPRTVYSAVDTSYMRAHRPRAFSWPELERVARRDRARYILVWALRFAPRGPLPGRALVRSGAGTLVEVAP